MDPVLSHDQLQDLLGAVAVHALDPDEAAAVQTHLSGCPRCRDEVAHYEQAAAMLASAGRQAPPGVWDAIAAAIERPATPTAPRLTPNLPGAVRPPHSPRPHRRTRLAVSAGAVAAAAAAAIAVLGVEVGRLNHRLNHLASANVAGTISAAAANAVLDPRAQRAILTAPGSTSPDTTAEVLAEPSGAAFLFNRRLGPLGRSQTYQLWAMSDGRAVSVGLLGPHPSIVAFSLDPAHTADTLAITVEPAGGSVTPSRAPIARTTS